MARSWIVPIIGLYILAAGVPLTVMVARWRQQQHQQRQRMSEDAPTMPTIPSLPAVLPGYLFDNSEPPPEDGGAPTTYCPSCWVRDVTRIGSAWALPAGTPLFCLEHAYTTLARAVSARAQEQQQQQQTGDRLP